jgi:hypothetical protein
MSGVAGGKVNEDVRRHPTAILPESEGHVRSIRKLAGFVLRTAASGVPHQGGDTFLVRGLGQPALTHGIGEEFIPG